ncbi:hypothetical protein DFAR_210002 [Desulfarculales bacterium]
MSLAEYYSGRLIAQNRERKEALVAG